MQISSRFSVAIHILALLEFSKGSSLTSDEISESVNTNPVVIRRVIGMLKKYGLVESKRGSNGTRLKLDAEDISLLSVYQAVSGEEKKHLFRVHDHPNINCEIGAHIEEIVSERLHQAQLAMENVLYHVSLASIVQEINQKNSLNSVE